jgi:alpha-ketoglutarate-dependent taurine dioxygenase
MGWFTQRRLNNLWDRMEEVEDQQHRLLHVQAVQLQHLEEVESAIKQLYQSLKKGHTAWISYSSLDYACDQLRANLQKLIRALQAAHHRRLLIDLLPSDTLRKLFDTAARKARSLHHQLLLRHPSDLLQIETSYVHDGYNVHLILHIPMAPADLLMRLFQLRPFPLPFMETDMLMPNPDHQILAISANAD